MNPTPPSGQFRRLAQQLLTQEAEILNGSESPGTAAIRLTEKLRVSLTRLAGTSGYRTLLARALTLAKMRAGGTSAIHAVVVMPNGSLQGLDTLGDSAEAAEAPLLLITQLLELLVLFIGEYLVLRLLSDVWPGLAPDEAGLQQEPKK